MALCRRRICSWCRANRLFLSEIALTESTFRSQWSAKVSFAKRFPLPQKRFAFRCYQNCFIAFVVAMLDLTMTVNYERQSGQRHTLML
jgi:hypothetical protein